MRYISRKGERDVFHTVMIGKGGIMKKTDTDEQLFRSFLCGDHDSFNELMERYGDRVTRYIGGRIADQQEAEDLMIEAFSRVIIAEPDFISEGTFRAYLFKTARTVAIRFNKGYRLHHHFGLEDYSAELIGGEDHLEGMVHEEQNRIILNCMDQLKPDYREALYLRYYENMNLQQIGVVMRKNRKAVENLLGRGRNMLGTLLKQEGIDSNRY